MKKTKKAAAILIILAMAFTLAACGGGTESSSPPASQAPASQAPASQAPASPGETIDMGSGQGAAGEKTGESVPFPNANPDGSINLDRIAHYDVNYDYTQNERYKCTYISQDGGPLYQQSAAAYEHWAPLYNMEWVGFQSSNGDADLWMTLLQNSLDQGVKCFILDPDTTIMPAVVEKMNQYPDAAWLTQMAAPRDGTSGPGIPLGGNMLNNYVGFDNYDAGWQVTQKVLQWRAENIPDVPWEDIGGICMAFSTSPPLNQRVMAAKDAWLAAGGLAENWFEADASTYGINFQGGLDAVGPIITTNTDIKYWLVNGLIDDFAQAAAAVIDQQGLTENSAVACFGGSALQMQWDAGTHDSFRFALFTAQNLYAEPIIGGVYAFLNGWATPETIWPSWVKWDDKGGEGHTFSNLRLPTVWLLPDTYKHYLEWTDMYAKANAYDYPQDGIKLSDYSPFVTEIPADFKAP